MYAPAHPLRLAHREAGSGSPVVLLHGLADSSDLWRHQVPVLSQLYRTIVLDLRGHGRSPLGTPHFDLATMADDVQTTLSHLGVDDAVVMGLSMGGGVAQSLTLRHAALVRALVLVSTSSEFPEATRRRFVDRGATAERQGMEAVVDATVPRWFTSRFIKAHPEEVERTRRVVLEMDPVAFAAASRANAVRRFTDELHSIACPVLFIGGTQDPADPRRALEIYRRELASLREELIPDASHLVPVEAADAFNAIVLRFLRDVEPKPAAPGGTGS